jgi:hypothetical protein
MDKPKLWKPSIRIHALLAESYRVASSPHYHTYVGLEKAMRVAFAQLGVARRPQAGTQQRLTLSSFQVRFFVFFSNLLYIHILLYKYPCVALES